MSLGCLFLSLSVHSTSNKCLWAVIQTREATPQIDAHTWQHSEDSDCLPWRLFRGEQHSANEQLQVEIVTPGLTQKDHSCFVCIRSVLTWVAGGFRGSPVWPSSGKQTVEIICEARGGQDEELKTVQSSYILTEAVEFMCSISCCCPKEWSFLLWLCSELGINSISQLVFFHKNRIVIKWWLRDRFRKCLENNSKYWFAKRLSLNDSYFIFKEAFDQLHTSREIC